MIELDKIYNEDCVKGLELIEDKGVDMVLTDIPYGECNRFAKCDFRKINKGSTADGVDFDLEKLVDTITNKVKKTVYIFCGVNQVSEIRKIMLEKEMSTRLCIWEKTNPSPMNGQKLWLSSIECCVFGKFSNATFNESCKSCVWKFPCGTAKIHPTQKPLKLFKYLISVSSNEGDIVLDPFSGSGTTAIAAKHLNRRFIAFEKNKSFYETSLKRFTEETAQLSLF